MEDVQVLEGRWKRFHGFHAFLLELQTPTSVYMETSLIQSIENLNRRLSSTPKQAIAVSWCKLVS